MVGWGGRIRPQSLSALSSPETPSQAGFASLRAESANQPTRTPRATNAHRTRHGWTGPALPHLYSYPIGPTHTSSSRKLTRPLGSARPSPFIYTALLLPVSQNGRSDAASPPLASLSAPWVRVSLCECVPSARGSHSTHKPHALHSSDTAASFRSPAPHCRRSHCRRSYVAPSCIVSRCVRTRRALLPSRPTPLPLAEHLRCHR